jgi:hypothetical protein
MPNHSFGEEDHRKVWEIWLDTRNWTKTAEIGQYSVHTIRNWAKADFLCPDGCQFHDYENLLAQVRTLRQSRNKLIAEENYNIVDHHEAAIRTIKGDEAATTLASIDDSPAFKIFRKDEEKLGDLESLWDRIMYQATDAAPPGSKKTKAELDQELRQNGLSIRNLKEGIACLRDLHSMMQELRGKKEERNQAPAQKSPLAAMSKQDLMALVKLTKQKPQIIIDATDVKTS